MTLVRWKNRPPRSSHGELSPLAALRNEMDRLFEGFTREPLGGIEWPFLASGRWTPAVDVSEDDKTLTIRAEVPGIDPEDLEVTVSGDQLVLAGEKKESVEKSEKDFYQSERRFGSFRRTVPLPEAVDPDKVQAEYANGVLTIYLYKSEATAAKRIEVKVKD